MARRGILWVLLSAAAFSAGLAEARVAPHAAAKQPTVNPWAFPDTFGETCVVGGSAYVNLSLPGREEKLLHLLELPRCLHEGASWKEKHGWKLHVKDKKVQRKIRWKEKRVLLAAAKKDRKEAAAAASARTAFAMPNEIRMLPANSPRLSPVCLGLTMVGPSLFGRGVVGAGSGRSSLCSLVPGPGAAAAAPASLLLPRPFGNGLGSGSKIAMDAGKGFGLSAPGGDQGKPGKGKGGKTSGLRGSEPGKVREVEMQFTCNKCETRQSKKFTRHAYEKGIVIVDCEGCGVKHLIADHMGWYKDWTNEAGGTTVEEMLASKGFKVDNRLRDWSPEDDEQVEGFQPLTNDGKPLTMTRRDDGTYEVDVVEEE